MLVVTQPSAVLSEVALARFFEAGWTERPGGSTAELAILLARLAARLHGARLEVSSAGGGDRRDHDVRSVTSSA